MSSYIVPALGKWTEALKTLKTPGGIYGQRIQVIGDWGLFLDSHYLAIEFSAPFDDDPLPNEAEISVYNLSENTLSQIRPDKLIRVHAGYGLDGYNTDGQKEANNYLNVDLGLLFYGTIKEVRTTQQGSDRKTTFWLVDTGASEEEVDLSYGEGVLASTILRDLIDRAGMQVADIQLPKDRSFAKSVSVKGAVNAKIAEYAEMCGSMAYIYNRLLYVRDLRQHPSATIEVSQRTGLLESPEPFSKEEKDPTTDDKDAKIVWNGYKLKMLLNHRITTGVAVNLQSRDANGTYTVRSGKHTFDGTNLLTEAEVIE